MIEKNVIKQVLIDQREDWHQLSLRSKIIEREAYPSFRKQADADIIKVVMGIRRCGKSVFAYQLFKDKYFAFLNFDDERLAGLTHHDLNTVLKTIHEVYGDCRYFIFDEIQNVPHWELFATRLHRQGYNLLITGSNAKLLSRELSTHLTGRHIRLELFPFSFREYLHYHNIEWQDLMSTKSEGIIRQKFDEYLQYGGFPETLQPNVDRKSYIHSLYSAILARDIVMRHRIRFTKSFVRMANYLLSNYSSPTSYNKLKNLFDFKSIHTAMNYVEFLEEAYLFFFVNRLSYKLKESLLAPRKCYCIDLGFIQTLSIKHMDNYGRLFENLVAIELMRRKSYDDFELYYWQDYQKHEVDFVIKRGLKVEQLIQVCYAIENPDTKKREVRALLKASEELRCKNLLILTNDYEAEENLDRKTIRYLPLWKWILGIG